MIEGGQQNSLSRQRSAMMINTLADITTEFLSDAFPYALGYWQGRACGHYENGTYENMTDVHKYLYKIGYDAGIADFVELDEMIDDKRFDDADGVVYENE
jgi:hypothetical protein